MPDEHGSEEQEGFGEATLGEAQSSDPPADPEMIERPGDDEPAEDEVVDPDIAPDEEVIDPDAGIDADEDNG